MAGGSFGVYAESTRDKRSEWRVLDFSAASLANPVGRHDVRRATSAGTVAVERTGDTFRVVWTVNGRSTEGIGMLDGETFSVAFSSGMEAGIAVYAVSEKGWDELVTTGAAGGEPIKRELGAKMKVYQFTEQPYPEAWKDHAGSLRVNLPNRKCDPRSRPICSTAITTSGCSPTSSASTSWSTSIIRPPPACRRR